MKKEKLTIIKVGGKIVEDKPALKRLLADFSTMDGKKLLVHGGGRSATALAARLGIETKMVEGRRITDDAMLEVVVMVYGGLVNKCIVAGLQAIGVNAVGLTGADMDALLSVRRPAGKASCRKSRLWLGWGCPSGQCRCCFYADREWMLSCDSPYNPRRRGAFVEYECRHDGWRDSQGFGTTL